MKTAHDLETEINSLEDKQSRLRSDLSAAQAAHEEARAAVVQVGDPSSLEAVTSAHSRMTALTDALKTLEGQIAEKRTAFKTASESERQERVRAEIATRKEGREQARLDYLKCRERANEALKEPVQAMFEAAQRFNQAGDQIRELYASIGVEAQRLSGNFGVSELQPYGYEIDQCYARLIRISAAQDEEERREERRRLRSARSVAA